MLLQLTFNEQNFEGSTYCVSKDEAVFLHLSSCIIQCGITYNQACVRSKQSLSLRVYCDNDLVATLNNCFVVQPGNAITSHILQTAQPLNPRVCRTFKIMIEDTHGNIVRLSQHATIVMHVQTSIPEFNCIQTLS